MEALLELDPLESSAAERAAVGRQLHASGALDGDSVAVWECVEALALALLELGQDEPLCATLVARVARRFPGSRRARCLQQLLDERRGSLDDALARYKALGDADATDAFARKRYAAVLVRAGRPAEAVAALVAFVTDFGGDALAWRELGALYAAQGLADRAQYCVEEALLARPQSVATLCSYAALLASERPVVARKYYCLAAEQCCIALKASHNERHYARHSAALLQVLDSLEPLVAACKDAESVALRAWVERKREDVIVAAVTRDEK